MQRPLNADELLQLMRKAHVFVSTTFADPFNNTILEAMGAQLPIISSDISSIPEIVEHERNGFLLPVADRSSEQIAEDIAQHLTKLMDDTELLNRFGAGSYAVVREKFDIQVRNRQLKDLYDRALS